MTTDKTITHDEFVSGLADGTLQFGFLGEPHVLLKGFRLWYFNALCLSYQVFPLIAIPLFAWREDNWWLLIGIVFAMFGWFRGAHHAIRTSIDDLGKDSVAAFLVIACVLSWLVYGFRNYWTFFPLCTVWTFMFFSLAEYAQRDFERAVLKENPELFDKALNSGLIVVRSSKSNTAGD